MHFWSDRNTENWGVEILKNIESCKKKTFAKKEKQATYFSPWLNGLQQSMCFLCRATAEKCSLAAEVVTLTIIFAEYVTGRTHIYLVQCAQVRARARVCVCSLICVCAYVFVYTSFSLQTKLLCAANVKCTKNYVRVWVYMRTGAHTHARAHTHTHTLTQAFKSKYTVIHVCVHLFI